MLSSAFTEVEMKSFIKSLLLVLVTLVLLFTAFPVTASAQSLQFKPRLTAPQRSNAYYNRELNVYSQTGYGMPNCVAYAFGRVYEITGEKPLITRGSANEWWSINKRNGYYEYGQEPHIGAIACWSNHVAVVEKIDGNTVTASQSHWGGAYFDTTTFESGTNRFGQKFYGYIYASDDYFEELEKQKAQQEAEKVKQRLGEKTENMSSIAPAEKKTIDFPAVELLPEKDKGVLINSVMLKNVLEME